MDVDVEVLPEVAGMDVTVLAKATAPDVDMGVDVDVDALPEVADAVPELLDDAAIPVHGLMVLVAGIATTGSGALINGLTPALAISVEPRGIVPPLSVKVSPAPGVESGEAVPVEATSDVVQPDIESADPVALDPPPSKVELMLADDPAMLEPAALQFELIAGLRPPGSTSVAPRVRPVPPTKLEPGTPSGDVVPIAGAVIVLCAWPVPQLIRTAVTKTIRRIVTSCTILPLLRIGNTWVGQAKIGDLRATAHTMSGSKAAPRLQKPIGV